MSALAEKIFNLLSTKYVQEQDIRQQAMGLQYTTAETHDLSKTIADALTVADYNHVLCYSGVPSCWRVKPEDMPQVRIIEEVPGVEPHWFVTGGPYGHKPTFVHPHFEKHEQAVAFCEIHGYSHTTEYFEP